MNKINYFLEYLSLLLILLYFFNHNIYLVLIGITFSLYLINSTIIDNHMRAIINTFTNRKPYREVNKNDKRVKANSINMNLTKEDSKLTLVETIEELGFIPIVDKAKDNNAT